MTTIAAGTCPACKGWLMIVPEPLAIGVWAWQCPTCTTFFATGTDTSHYEIDETDTEPGGQVKPKRRYRKRTGGDVQEGDLA